MTLSKPVEWSKEKNEILKKERGIGFEDIVEAFDQNHVIDSIDHPNKQKYGHQKIFVVYISQYIYFVPYVEDDRKIFLKTIFANRRAMKQYI